MSQDLRRKERAISKEESFELLRRGEYGVLSTASSDRVPYGVPLSFCLLEDAIYFHCALEGRKLNNITSNSEVSFCVVGKTEVQPDIFSTKYESVIISGRVQEVFAEEKNLALAALIDKYSSAYREEGMKYIELKGSKTRVYRISPDTVSGKARR